MSGTGRAEPADVFVRSLDDEYRAGQVAGRLQAVKEMADQMAMLKAGIAADRPADENLQVLIRGWIELGLWAQTMLQEAGEEMILMATAASTSRDEAAAAL